MKKTLIILEAGAFVCMAISCAMALINLDIWKGLAWLCATLWCAGVLFRDLFDYKYPRPKVRDIEAEITRYCKEYYNCEYPKQIEDGTCTPTMHHIVQAAKHFALWAISPKLVEFEKEDFDDADPNHLAHQHEEE